MISSRDVGAARPLPLMKRSPRACSRDELSNSVLAAGRYSDVFREGEERLARVGGRPGELIDSSLRAIISSREEEGSLRAEEKEEDEEESLTREALGAVANA
jgi:hypothetical protein